MTHHIHGKPSSWLPHEDEKIIQGIREGWTWGRIAAALPGRTTRTARLRADRMGIRPVRKPTADREAICPVEGSRALLESMEASFAMFSRRHGVDLLDARILLLTCAGVA